MLGLEEIANDILKKRLQRILVKDNNELIYILKNGKEIKVHWDDPKRSDSWTDEMKEQVRQRSLKLAKERRKLCQQ